MKKKPNNLSEVCDLYRYCLKKFPEADRQVILDSITRILDLLIGECCYSLPTVRKLLRQMLEEDKP